MANHAATKKDVRQATKRRERNRYYGKTTRNAIRDIRAVTGQKDAADKLPAVASMIDTSMKCFQTSPRFPLYAHGRMAFNSLSRWSAKQERLHKPGDANEATFLAGRFPSL